MKKAIQISVPQPCHEDWNRMTPQEQGRFCDSCQKCVIDFTRMNDRQLYNFMKKHEGQDICGNFLSSQLERPIAAPAPPPNRLYRWAAAAGLVLCFTALPDSYARAFTVPTEQVMQQNSDSKDSAVIKGQVLDDNNEPMIGAIIEVQQGGITKGGAQTDFDGYYKITLPAAGRYDMKVSYVGYKTNITQKVVANIDGITIVDVKMEVSTTETEEVTIVGYRVPLIDKSSVKNDSVEVIEKMGIRNTATLVPTTTGAYQSSDGSDLTIRGARTEGTLYYIDGVQVQAQPPQPKHCNIFSHFWFKIKQLFN